MINPIDVNDDKYGYRRLFKSVLNSLPDGTFSVLIKDLQQWLDAIIELFESEKKVVEKIMGEQEANDSSAYTEIKLKWLPFFYSIDLKPWQSLDKVDDYHELLDKCVALHGMLNKWKKTQDDEDFAEFFNQQELDKGRSIVDGAIKYLSAVVWVISAEQLTNKSNSIPAAHLMDALSGLVAEYDIRRFLHRVNDDHDELKPKVEGFHKKYQAFRRAIAKLKFYAKQAIYSTYLTWISCLIVVILTFTMVYFLREIRAERASILDLRRETTEFNVERELKFQRQIEELKKENTKLKGYLNEIDGIDP